MGRGSLGKAPMLGCIEERGQRRITNNHSFQVHTEGQLAALSADGIVTVARATVTGNEAFQVVDECFSSYFSGDEAIEMLAESVERAAQLRRWHCFSCSREGGRTGASADACFSSHFFRDEAIVMLAV